MNVGFINLGNLSADPASPIDGQFWYNSTLGKYRCKEDGAVKDMISGGGGSDPWTYIKLASEFTTTVIPVSDIGLAFTPAANTTYEFEAQILVRAASTATGARVGLAWNTGNTDGAAMITSPNANGNGFATSIGGTNASLLAAATGMPTNTNSALATIKGTVIVGESPSGDIKIQLASEVAASLVTARVGSFLKYRVLP